MNTSTARQPRTPRESYRDTQESALTSTERVHADVWADLPKQLRADLMRSVGIVAHPDMPYAALRPMQRDLIRAEACARVGLAAPLGGFLA